jgi:SsrA-binding protein
MSTIASNKKAFHNYHILEKFEAGIQLVSSEVKSCVKNEVNLADAFARIENGELYLYNAHIAKYSNATLFNHEPTRTRKLLMKSREIIALSKKIAQNGLTLVPLSFYTKGPFIKVELALVKGKNSIDKREDLKRKDVDRNIRRFLKN